MYFCVFNIEYDFIGVYCGFIFVFGIILNIYILIYGYYESYSLILNNSEEFIVLDYV